MLEERIEHYVTRGAQLETLYKKRVSSCVVLGLPSRRRGREPPRGLNNLLSLPVMCLEREPPPVSRAQNSTHLLKKSKCIDLRWRERECGGRGAGRRAGNDRRRDAAACIMVATIWKREFRRFLYPYGTVYATKRLTITLRAAPRAPPGGYQG
eukprot:COSAG03_NODE_79_length_14054_cov_53.206951_2_plen_153_part_00